MDALSLLDCSDDRSLFEQIGAWLAQWPEGQSRIQSRAFVLNVVENVGSFGQVQQAMLELRARQANLIDTWFEARALDVKTRILDRKIAALCDDLQIDLLQIERDKLAYRRQSLLQRLKVIVREARQFAEVVEEHQHILTLSPEEREDAELDFWAEKSRQFPTVFEERYGDELVRQLWGDEDYAAWLDARHRAHGLLPREVFKYRRELAATDERPKIRP